MTDFAELLERQQRRPWAAPARPWVLHMRWTDLLFAHWLVSSDRLAATLPPGLQLDTFQGKAFLGLVPFRMEAVGPRGMNGFPGMTTFPEVNVRTYVIAGDKPGVYFFSLDAASALTVLGARSLLGLPYWLARSKMAAQGEKVLFETVRRIGAGHLKMSYRPAGPGEQAARGTLDHWLTERYCLYSRAFGRTTRLEIHHEPWLLQPAEATIENETLLAAAGLEVAGPPATLHFSRRIDVIAWSPSPID